MYPILCLQSPRISIRGFFFGPVGNEDVQRDRNDCSFCPRLFYGFTIEWSMEYLKEIMERVKGLEPSTCAMATRRSSQLSYTRFHIL